VRSKGIVPLYTPSGLHNNLSERYTQTVKTKKRILLAALPYVLPKFLHFEALLSAARSCNISLNHKSGDTKTPYFLMKKRRPDIDEYSFGTVGLAYVIRADNRDVRGEMSVMLEQKGSGSYRVYIPTRKLVYSVRRFEPLRSNSYPLQWNWERKEEIKLEGKLEMNYDVNSKFNNNIERLDKNLIVDSHERSPYNIPDHIRMNDKLDNDEKETYNNTDNNFNSNESVNKNAIDMNVGENDKLDNNIINDDKNEINIKDDIDESEEENEVAIRKVRTSDRLRGKTKQGIYKEMNIAASFKNARDVTGNITTMKEDVKKDYNNMMIELMKGRNEAVIRPNVVNDPKFSKKEIKGMVKTMLATKSVEPECFYGHATADEERFIKYYTNKRTKPKDRHNIKGKDNGLRRKTEEFWEESINMVKEDLNKESFRDAISAYHLTLQKIIKGNDQAKIIEADKAGRKEVNNIMDNHAMRPIKYKDMTSQQKGNTHRAFMFYKDKYDDGGKWESLKARLVVNGSTVPTNDLGDLYAGTVQPISVMTILATAAMKGYDVATFDIKGAYLIPEVDPNEPDIVVKLDREIADLFVKEYPHLSDMLEHDGTMHMLLLKYLYGLPQAAAHFHDHLSKSLLSMGFRKTKVDGCVYVKDGYKRPFKIMAGTHVDDILVAGSKEDLKKFKLDLMKLYKITSNEGAVLSYISLYIKWDSERNILVSQTGYRLDVLSKYRSDLEKIKEYVSTPGDSKLLELEENEEKYQD